MSGFAP